MNIIKFPADALYLGQGRTTARHTGRYFSGHVGCWVRGYTMWNHVTASPTCFPPSVLDTRIRSFGVSVGNKHHLQHTHHWSRVNTRKKFECPGFVLTVWCKIISWTTLALNHLKAWETSCIRFSYLTTDCFVWQHMLDHGISVSSSSCLHQILTRNNF